MKSILVVYYSQTGQLEEILKNLLGPLASDPNIHIDYERINPIPDYSFPWKSDDFFNVFPESVKLIPCEIKPVNPPLNKYDLIILGYSVWYLSPSLPVTSFLHKPETHRLLKGKKIITISGVRNMWVMAQEDIKSYLYKMEAELVGNIVFTDKSNNLISVITIIKWLIKGNKGPYRFLPSAGVSDKEIAESSKYGTIIKKHLLNNDYLKLQDELTKEKAVEIQYNILQMEKNAKRIFRIWAGLILKAEKKNKKTRLLLVRLFKYYLLFVIFIISPIASLFFNLKKIILRSSSESDIKYYSGIKK